MPLVFGSDEANELLARTTGRRFDLADANPFDPIDLPDHDTAESYCTVCGGYMEWEDCWHCGGAGEFDAYEDDPMWYEPGDTEECTECHGAGGYWECTSLPHEPADAA